MNHNIKTVPVSAYEAVLDTARRYVDGLKQGSAETLAGAFHKDAVMYGFTDGELLGGPVDNLYKFVRENGSAPEIETHLDVLAITPTTSVVRVDMENDAIGTDYNDYLTLIRIDDRWQVIAKVYHQFTS
ncbi:nuclear transport factor 2 family protein [Pantoea allii]|uniref:nuclear transport factor 2 family protein n=1 Tax=Pantoea allii TaxID=574096 RepID=UPI0024B7C407|nr:nuclear transport factor 2 family protein [Pantoea allii]MDJ0042919.1 nuclear transport factor 2 family protein [Pantoea allii]